jgi:hypothetical protein
VLQRILKSELPYIIRNGIPQPDRMYRKGIGGEVSRMRRNQEQEWKRIAESDLRINGEKKNSYVNIKK